MKKESVLIIGAGGYIGAHLAWNLSCKGYQVTAFCHRQREGYPEWHAAMQQIIYGDITDPLQQQALVSSSYDYVLYLISLNHSESEQETQKVCHTNVLPLWTLSKLLKNRVKKFIYFSTQQVYGKTVLPLIEESTPAAPVNTYGLTHLLCEDIIRYSDSPEGTRFINVRLSNGYGLPVFKDTNCWWLVINDLCRSAVEEHRIRLLSNGSPQRDFIHTDDITEAINILLQTASPDTLYNLSSGITCTIGEIARTVQNLYRQLTNAELPLLLPEGKQLITTAATPWQISNQKLRKLGFIPQKDIRTGIRQMLQTLLKTS